LGCKYRGGAKDSTGEVKKKLRIVRNGAFRDKPGGVLLSHTVTHAVPSAPKSLTSEFGMGSGMAFSISPPENFGISEIVKVLGWGYNPNVEHETEVRWVY